MDKGAKTVILILIAASVLGALVIYFNPDYRGTFDAWRNGARADAPVLVTNTEYYDGLALPEDKEAANAE